MGHHLVPGTEEAISDIPAAKRLALRNRLSDHHQSQCRRWWQGYAYRPKRG
jgi:hypothetical protein